MPSSELSNALNPYVSQSRARPPPPGYLLPYEPVNQPPPQQHIPHRSELELAITEPEPPPPPPPVNAITIRQPTPANIQAVQELLRIVAATRDSQEIERKRRLAWEQEQEAKYTRRQAELESLILDMRQEISILRSNTHMKSTAPSGLLTPHPNMSPAPVLQRPPQPASPISPVSQPSFHAYPTFVQGSSNQPSVNYQPRDFQMSPQSEATIIEPPASSVTPSPSPQLPSIQSSQFISSLANIRKRRASQLSSDGEDNSQSSDSSASNPQRFKRISHHDKRCLTIHHAIRAHLLRVMHLDSDKDLPDSHTEGVPIGPNDPVRFVWDKTTKQSVHNARMKARVLADIKSNRKLYKHVADKDFGKKILEAAFEASFVTFRQKFKAQRDEALAFQYKKREESKAQKARRVARRKQKLSNRADARLRIEAFQHVTFDGALQLECMSSEESDQEVAESTTQPNGAWGMLRTRGYSWRSTRLKRFYETLDDEEKADKSSKPKRGGKKERQVGLPKEGFYLPPKGVATWMISRQWIRTSRIQYPDLPEALAKLVHDSPGFNWDQFDALGEESDVSSNEHQTTNGQHSYTSPQHQTSNTSSLNYALV